MLDQQIIVPLYNPSVDWYDNQLGEKLDALDLFYPDRMAERILGMGDVVSLVERAQQVFDEEQAKKIQDAMQHAPIRNCTANHS